MVKVVSALALITLASSSVAIQMLLNSGFEDGALSPWNQVADLSGPVDWEVTSADVFSGSFSAYAEGERALVQTFVKYPLGLDVFEFSFWMKTTGEMRAIVEYTDATTQEVAFFGNGSWDFYDVTSSIDPAKNVLGVGFWAPADAGVYLDDVTFDAFPVPEPTALFAVVLGVGALLRRRTGSR